MLADQEIYTTENRRWTGKRKRFLDTASKNYLLSLAPEAEDRIVDGAEEGISHKLALEQARIKAIVTNKPYCVVVPIDVITSGYFEDTCWAGYKSRTLIPRGRIKTTEHEKNRAATGSAVVIFYPELGEPQPAEFVWRNNR